MSANVCKYMQMCTRLSDIVIFFISFAFALRIIYFAWQNTPPSGYSGKKKRDNFRVKGARIASLQCRSDDLKDKR